MLFGVKNIFQRIHFVNKNIYKFVHAFYDVIDLIRSKGEFHSL